MDRNILHFGKLVKNVPSTSVKVKAVRKYSDFHIRSIIHFQKNVFQTSQIWNPEKLAAYENDARDKAKARNISLSKIIAQVSAMENGGVK